MRRVVMRQVRDSDMQIPKLRFAEPRHNLPGRKGVATAEDRFTIAFSRAYASQAKELHRGSTRSLMMLAREIPVNGYGIADLCVVAWSGKTLTSNEDNERFVRDANPSVLAFECKLGDWKRAMSQGSRYRFFASQAIVVLPDEQCRHALEFVETFRRIHVGLWSFQPDSQRIIPHFTPRAQRPKSHRHYVQAVLMVRRASRRVLPIAQTT